MTACPSQHLFIGAITYLVVGPTKADPADRTRHIIDTPTPQKKANIVSWLVGSYWQYFGPSHRIFFKSMCERADRHLSPAELRVHPVPIQIE
jgi:hypothetical protein